MYFLWGATSDSFYFTALLWPLNDKTLSAYYVPCTLRISGMIHICNSSVIDSDSVVAEQMHFGPLLTLYKRTENVTIALMAAI